MHKPGPPLRVAVLDLYDGEPNQGMRALRALLEDADGRFHGQAVTYAIYDVRAKAELPDLGYDVYLSSGGPGSPFDGEGTTWEHRYWRWLDALYNHNERHAGSHLATDAKHVLFICHSYQMMCRFFEVARVTKRRSESFGIFPVHKTDAGRDDPQFAPLSDPFYAADFRHFQAVEPDAERIGELGGAVLALEKPRPRIRLERATMALRLSPEILGVQFHPEADPEGMRHHFAQPKRMQHVVRKHGEPKYWRIMRRLVDPDFLAQTHDAFLPLFLRRAVEAQRPEVIDARAA
ncbi:MAG: hypothetical protein R3247_10145 [Rhodothermales bacterium]|nr:hypothetical protein [Rhodothermales bacterium]